MSYFNITPGELTARKEERTYVEGVVAPSVSGEANIKKTYSIEAEDKEKVKVVGSNIEVIKSNAFYNRVKMAYEALTGRNVKSMGGIGQEVINDAEQTVESFKKINADYNGAIGVTTKDLGTEKLKVTATGIEKIVQ